MANLNYNAEVPISIRAPFVVTADPNKPPGDRFKDYIPKDQVVPVKASSEVRKKNFMRPPVSRRTDSDYISGSDAAIIRNKEKENIIVIAKQIYESEKNKRAAYAHAQEILASGTASVEEIARANKVIEKAKPLTKDEALELATKQFYGVRT